MKTRYARLNFQLREGPELHEIAAKYQAELHNAAIEGYAHEDDIEVFFLEKTLVVGISVVFDNEVGLLEAGGVLGYCLRVIEDADDLPGSESWFSIHDEKDSTLYSPLEGT